MLFELQRVSCSIIAENSVTSLNDAIYPGRLEAVAITFLIFIIKLGTS